MKKFRLSKAEFVQLVKKKKDLSGLADSIIEQTLDSYLLKNSLSFEKLSPVQQKALLKEIRFQLRLLAGRFQKSLKPKNILDFASLLKTHASTAERLAFYPELKKIIDSLNIRSILDLGCGLNPLALASPGTEYYAVDIKEDELQIINEFFTQRKIKGKSFVFDIRNISSFQQLPKTDLCLIFKVLDVLGKQKRQLTEEILKKTPSRIFLISFSTKKLSGKPMDNPRRFWFEHILGRLALGFEKFSSANEVFYLIKPSPP